MFVLVLGFSRIRLRLWAVLRLRSRSWQRCTTQATCHLLAQWRRAAGGNVYIMCGGRGALRAYEQDKGLQEDR